MVGGLRIPFLKKISKKSQEKYKVEKNKNIYEVFPKKGILNLQPSTRYNIMA
jgi:hypothetical protein